MNLRKEIRDIFEPQGTLKEGNTIEVNDDIDVLYAIENARSRINTILKFLKSKDAARLRSDVRAEIEQLHSELVDVVDFVSNNKKWD